MVFFYFILLMKSESVIQKCQPHENQRTQNYNHNANTVSLKIIINNLATVRRTKIRLEEQRYRQKNKDTVRRTKIRLEEQRYG